MFKEGPNKRIFILGPLSTRKDSHLWTVNFADIKCPYFRWRQLVYLYFIFCSIDVNI